MTFHKMAIPAFTAEIMVVMLSLASVVQQQAVMSLLKLNWFSDHVRNRRGLCIRYISY
jgi:hypothetical protein